MRGENRLHTNRSQVLQNRLIIKTLFLHDPQLVRPKPFFSGRPVAGFPSPPHMSRDPLLDQVQQLEGNRIRLTQLTIRLLGCRKRFPQPWQSAGQIRVSKIRQHFGKGLHRKGQLAVE